MPQPLQREATQPLHDSNWGTDPFWLQDLAKSVAARKKRGYISVFTQTRQVVQFEILSDVLQTIWHTIGATQWFETTKSHKKLASWWFSKKSNDSKLERLIECCSKNSATGLMINKIFNMPVLFKFSVKNIVICSRKM